MPSILELDSVIGILVLDVADEDLVLSVPTFEVATSEFQQVCGWLFFENHDVLLGNIAQRFVLASVIVSVLVPPTQLFWTPYIM